jgi:hypothetical protein
LFWARFFFSLLLRAVFWVTPQDDDDFRFITLSETFLFWCVAFSMLLRSVFRVRPRKKDDFPFIILSVPELFLDLAHELPEV